jgi:DNA polymerase delta subunit 2
LLKKQDASYKHQYANLYFVRLAQLRKHTIARAKERWKDTTGTFFRQHGLQTSYSFSGNPKYLPRILEVSKGQLSWIVGTVYKEMPLKDNVLDDLAKEVRDNLII